LIHLYQGVVILGLDPGSTVYIESEYGFPGQARE